MVDPAYLDSKEGLYTALSPYKVLNPDDTVYNWLQSFTDDQLDVNIEENKNLLFNFFTVYIYKIS